MSIPVRPRLELGFSNPRLRSLSAHLGTHRGGDRHESHLHRQQVMDKPHRYKKPGLGGAETQAAVTTGSERRGPSHLERARGVLTCEAWGSAEGQTDPGLGAYPKPKVSSHISLKTELSGRESSSEFEDGQMLGTGKRILERGVQNLLLSASFSVQL